MFSVLDGPRAECSPTGAAVPGGKAPSRAPRASARESSGVSSVDSLTQARAVDTLHK